MSSEALQLDSDASKTVSPRRKRWAGYVLLGLIVVLGFFVVRAALLVRATPTYWQENQAFLRDTPAPDLQHFAQDIQSRTLREWSYPIGDGDGIRTVRYNFDEVNAWLATRLKPLLRNQNVELPSEIGEFMLTQRDGQLVLAFDYESETFGPRIASLVFRFQDQEGEAVSTAIKSARAGEQPLPVGYLIDRVADQPRLDDVGIQELLQRIANKQFVALPPIPVDDHREATVLGIEVRPEGVDLLIRVAYHKK